MAFDENLSALLFRLRLAEIGRHEPERLMVRHGSWLVPVESTCDDHSVSLHAHIVRLPGATHIELLLDGEPIRWFPVAEGLSLGTSACLRIDISLPEVSIAR